MQDSTDAANSHSEYRFNRLTDLWHVQLYNEEVHDLLSSDQTKLQIHESKESGIYVAGLREDIVTSAEHVLQLLYSGEKLRHFGETKMNKTSSRSHTIFRMVSKHACMMANNMHPGHLIYMPQLSMAVIFYIVLLSQSRKATYGFIHSQSSKYISYTTRGLLDNVCIHRLKSLYITCRLLDSVCIHRFKSFYVQPPQPPCQSN